MKKSPDTLAIAASPLIGLIYALAIFHFTFLTGTGDYWLRPFGDVNTSIIGALYFVRDEWRFPLFYVPSLGFPEGANIIFTDSIPLLALLAKFFYKATGHWVNYFGFYIVACFPLLAYFTALAVRQAGARDPVVILCAVLLALTSPALTVRFGHAALMGHFLIVWAIYLYFKLLNEPTDRGTLLQYGCAMLVAAFVQAYFVVMVFPFLLAALAQAVIERRVTPRFALTSAGLVALTAVVAAFIGGAIGSGSSSGAWGYGHYSMNILSPIIPVREWLPEFVARHITWDVADRSWDATGGQYEGYSYFGAGLIFLLIVQLTAWQSLKSALRRHLMLVLLAVGLTVYALSNRVFLGDWLVLDVPLPAIIRKLVSSFRTGGRYFWPVYYILVVALSVATWRRFQPRTAHMLLIFSALIQLADTSVLRRNTANAAMHGQPRELKAEDWMPLLSAHKILVQYPSFQCGGWAGAWPGNNSNMELLMMAAERNMPTNSAYLARLNRNCEGETLQGERFEIGDDGLYTFAQPFPIQVIEMAPDFQKLCRKFAFGIACTRHWDAVPAGGASATFAPISQSWIPAYDFGTQLSFAAGGNGKPYQAGGWSILEPWGTWGLGERSEIMLRLPATTKPEVRIDVEAFAFVHPGRPKTQLTVLANGEKVDVLDYAVGDEHKKYSFAVPSSLIEKAGGTLRLSFVPAEAQSPRQAGQSSDFRKLGIALVGLSISE